MKIEYNEVGYSQISINQNCDYADFYAFAERLASLAKITYVAKFDGLDDLYWDFDFEDTEMVLTYNVYMGIAICPRKFKNTNSHDNEKLTSLFESINI